MQENHKTLKYAFVHCDHVGAVCTHSPVYAIRLHAHISTGSNVASTLRCGKLNNIQKIDVLV